MRETVETDEAKVEAACLEALVSREQAPKTGKDAATTLVDAIVEEMDGSHHKSLMEENGEDPEAVWSAVDDVVRQVVLSRLYEAATLRLHRALRVTCTPDEVRTTGTADEIGHAWSSASDLDEPDFLDQYGQDGGRDVFLVADVDHADVDWFSTFEQRVNPWIRDYCEVVLKGTARPRVLSVSDPAAEARATIPVA